MSSTVVRRSARAARSESRRTEIIRSLGLVLQERGLAGMTMAKVADRLGMTKGSLYYYFKDKDDLLYHCHLRATEASLAALAHGGGGRRPDERLHEVLVGHIRGITDQVYGAVVLTDLETISAARRGRIVGMRDRFERGVRRLIREGIDAGVFAPVDAKLAGFAILGAVNWIPKWYDPRGAVPAGEIAERFADLLVRALKPEPARARSSATSGRLGTDNRGPARTGAGAVHARERTRVDVSRSNGR